VLDGFFDIVLKEGIIKALDRRELADVTIRNVAARQCKFSTLGVHWHIRCGKIVGHTLAVAGPFSIKGPHCSHIHQGNLLDKIIGLVDQGLDVVEFLHVQRVRAVKVNGIGNTTHSYILDMGRFAAQDRNDIIDLSLVFKSLQIMGCRQQIYLRLEFHGRMPPVSAAVDAELSRIHQGLQTLLSTLDFLVAVALPGR